MRTQKSPYLRGLVTVEGVDLHYAELGQGRPTVLLHGLGDSHRTWARVAPVLARTRRVLLLDLAGHGLSARPNASYALPWHTRLVAGWLDALGLDEVDVVGHSFGGGVAQWLLVERPGRVRRLALVAAGGLGREVSWSIRLASLTPIVGGLGQPFMGLGTRIALRACPNAFDGREIAHQAWINSMPGSARALSRSASDVVGMFGQRRNVLDRLDEAGPLPPMSLYWGEDDSVLPIAHGKWAAGFFEGASLASFAGCGHFPHRERPTEFAQALTAFIDEPGLLSPRVRHAPQAADSVRPRPSRSPAAPPSLPAGASRDRDSVARAPSFWEGVYTAVGRFFRTPIAQHQPDLRAARDHAHRPPPFPRPSTPASHRTLSLNRSRSARSGVGSSKSGTATSAPASWSSATE